MAQCQWPSCWKTGFPNFEVITLCWKLLRGLWVFREVLHRHYSQFLWDLKEYLEWSEHTFPLLCRFFPIHLIPDCSALGPTPGHSFTDFNPTAEGRAAVMADFILPSALSEPLLAIDPPLRNQRLWGSAPKRTLGISAFLTKTCGLGCSKIFSQKQRVGVSSRSAGSFLSNVGR